MTEKTSRTTEEQIEEIMDNFDFDKVHRVMMFLDWRWCLGDGVAAVPEKYQIREWARRLLREAHDGGATGTGGLWVQKTDYGHLSLFFCVDDWFCEDKE